MTRAKDENVPHYVEVIKRLLKELGDLSQAKFAELAKVSEPTVSAWLRGDNRRPPSPQAFIRMAALACNVDLAIEFLALAGISVDAMMAVSSRLTEKVLQATETGNIKNIVVSGETFGGMFADGEVITLELSGKDSRELQRFWDAVVLVEFSPTTQDQQDPARQWRSWPRKKFWVGRLTAKTVEDSPNVFLAVLHPGVPQETFWDFPTWRPGDRDICIGSWTLGVQNLHSFDSLKLPEWREWWKWARQEMKLFEGCRILGRMIGWYGPSEPLKKQDVK